MFCVLGKRIDKFGREWNDDACNLRDVIDASPRAPWLVPRVTALLATAVLVAWLGLAAPAAAKVSAPPAAVSAYTMTPERTVASSAIVVALISAVIGGLALARSAGRVGTGNGRRGAIVALVLGPIALVIGGLVVATAGGGLGTGHGLGGGVVAMLVGLIGMTLGGLALARSRRTDDPARTVPA